jgi:hypothetical protein
MSGRVIKKTAALAMVFGCGGLFFANLENLVPGVGNGYSASWLNVFLSLVLTIRASFHLSYYKGDI